MNLFVNSINILLKINTIMQLTENIQENILEIYYSETDDQQVKPFKVTQTLSKLH